MPSTSEGFSPASRIALRTAQVPSARVVLPDPRVYVVSPTPTIAYLSRKYFGVVASTSCRGNGMAFLLSVITGADVLPVPHRLMIANRFGDPRAVCRIAAEVRAKIVVNPDRITIRAARPPPLHLMTDGAREPLFPSVPFVFQLTAVLSQVP